MYEERDKLEDYELDENDEKIIDQDLLFDFDEGDSKGKDTGNNSCLYCYYRNSNTGVCSMRGIYVDELDEEELEELEDCWSWKDNRYFCGRS